MQRLLRMVVRARPLHSSGMCWRTVFLLHVTLLTCVPALAAPLSLEEAYRAAEANHASIANARAELRAVDAERREAGALFWNNPVITAEGRRRQLGQVDGPDVSRRDASLGISQTFETGGQPAARRAATKASLDAAEASVDVARRLVRSEAAQKFFDVAFLQQRLKVEDAALSLLQRALATVRKRVAAGEDSRLDGNVAAVEFERSANQVASVKEQLLQARAALAGAMRLAPGEQPEVQEPLTPSASLPYTRDELLGLAQNGAQVQAARAKELAAAKRADLEQAMRSPDVTVGLSHEPERGIDTRDRVTTLSVSVPLPLFRRNTAGIARALSDYERARLEREAAERDAAATVLTLWHRTLSAQERASRFRTEVLGRLEESEQLSLKSLQAGEIALGQYLLVRRQTLDARRELLDVLADLQRSRLELEAAAAWPRALPPLSELAN